MKVVFATIIFTTCLMVAAVTVEAGQSSVTFGATLRIAGGDNTSSNRTKQLRYTCGAAAYVLLAAGFSRVAATSCTGSSYYFDAILNGKPVFVIVDSTSGMISKL